MTGTFPSFFSSAFSTRNTTISSRPSLINSHNIASASSSSADLEGGKMSLLEIYVKPSALLLTLLLALIALLLTRRLATTYADWQRQATEHNQRQEIVHKHNRELLHSRNECKARGLFRLQSGDPQEPSRQLYVNEMSWQSQHWNPLQFDFAANDLVIMRHLTVADMIFCSFVTLFWATRNWNLAIIINGVFGLSNYCFRLKNC